MTTSEQLDTWGKKLIRKLEKGNLQERLYLQFLKGLVRRTESNMDAVIAICGERGMGKSSFSITSGIILRQLGVDFDFEDIHYGPETLKSVIPKIATSQKRAYVFDEMIDLAYSRNAMTTLNRRLAQFFTKIRKQNNVVFLCIPRFKTLDTAIRNDVVHFWCEVFWKSYALDHSKRFALIGLFRKDKNPLTDDPWGLETTKYMKKRAYTPRDQLRVMKKVRSFVCSLSCPPLPLPIEKQYEEMSRNYLKTSSADFVDTFTPKITKQADMG